MSRAHEALFADMAARTGNAMVGLQMLFTACHNLIGARNAGADVYEVGDEVDAIERAMATVNGEVDKHCTNCGSVWEPQHRHVLEHAWS